MYRQVEKYRAELRQKGFQPLSPEENIELKRFYHSAEFERMLGGKVSREIQALLDMFLAEKAPPEVAEPFIIRYVCEKLTGR